MDKKSLKLREMMERQDRKSMIHLCKMYKNPDDKMQRDKNKISQ